MMPTRLSAALLPATLFAGEPFAAVDDPCPTQADDPLSPSAAEEDPDPPGDRLAVALSLHVADCDPPLADWLPGALSAVAAEAGVVGRLSVAVVDDDEMAGLHATYHHDPTTTDVLTFDLTDGGAGGRVDGDVVVCLDEAARQAAARGRPTRDEALLYALHGLLHLAGEDDTDPAGFERMHRREDALLTAAGYGPIFSDGAGPGRDTAPTGGVDPT